MDRPNAFSKKNLKTINIEKRDWMEELNLPPQLIKFLRENARTLQIGVAIGLLLFFAISGLRFHSSRKLEQSTALLAKAVAVENAQERMTDLQQVVDKYSGSDAGLWARIDLAREAYDDGRSDDAISLFKQALDQAGKGNSIYPLIEYGLANAYEQKKDFSKAGEQFKALAGFKGFERQGYLGIARLQEKQGDLAAALQNYQKVASLDEEEKVSDNDWLKEKIRSLKATQAAPEEKTAGSSK